MMNKDIEQAREQIREIYIRKVAPHSRTKRESFRKVNDYIMKIENPVIRQAVVNVIYSEQDPETATGNAIRTTGTRSSNAYRELIKKLVTNHCEQIAV